VIDSDPGKEALPSCDLRTFIVNQFIAFCGLLLFSCESRVALLCVVPPFLAQDSLVEGSSRAEQFSAGSSRHQLPHGAAEPAARAAAERRCKGAALPRRAGTLQQGLAWEGGAQAASGCRPEGAVLRGCNTDSASNQRRSKGRPSSAALGASCNGGACAG